MDKPIPNKIRCRNCRHFKPIDKILGYCLAEPIMDTFAITSRSWQVPTCFEAKEGAS